MNRTLMKYLIYGLSFLCALWTILYLFRWESSWFFTRTTDQVQVIYFDPERLGRVPALFWLTQPTRLILVPRTWYSQHKRDVETWVTNLETGQTYWQNATELPIYEFKGAPPIEEQVLTLPSGVHVETRSDILPLWILGFTLSAYPSGVTGFYPVKISYGWLHLIVRETLNGPVIAGVSKFVFRERNVFGPDDLTILSPDQKFLIFVAPRGQKTENRIFVIGPFTSDEEQ